MNEIEYIIEDFTPVEANWLPLELPMFRDNRVKRAYPQTTLQQIKKLLRESEFTINVDFKIIPDYYGNTVKLKLHPRIEQYSSWIVLKWEVIREQYE